MHTLINENTQPWLEAHGFGFLRLFTYAEFQAICAALVSFAVVLLFGSRVIRWLQRKKIGDRPDFDQEQINELMASKSGTPTMGGLLIIAAILAGVVLLADLRNFYVLMALVCLVWLGVVGGIDDWLKLTAGRRSGSRQGLRGKEKLVIQIGLGVVLAWFTWRHGSNIPEAQNFYFPFFKNAELQLNFLAFMVITVLVITGSSNAVNLTDGLDGLAGGCTAICAIAFVVLALVHGDREVAQTLNVPYVQASDQMAVVAGAMLGACLGFLWFNCNPARVFMGDTGSLALGGLLGYIAIVVRQELMLFVIGGIFVAEALSVMLQVGYFKYTKRRFGEGRRILLMAPLHHHFQRAGWTETQVVVRFWLVGVMLAAIGLASVRLR